MVEAAYGRTIYLSTKGSDRNNGAQSAPVRTLEHAHSIANDGDNIAIETGMYPGKTTLTKKITLVSQGGSVLLDGEGSDFFVDAGPDVKTDVTTKIQLFGHAFRDGQSLSLDDVAVEWKWVSKPAGTVQRSPSWSVFNPTLHFSRRGIYVIELIVSEKSGAKRSARDTLTINVESTLLVDAGEDQTITLNLSDPAPKCVTLRGRVEDDGKVNPADTVYVWTSVPPGGPSIKDSNTSRPTICFATPGVYTYQLCASLGGETKCDMVTVQVLPSCSDSFKILVGPNRTALNPLLLPKPSLGGTPSICETFTAAVQGMSCRETRSIPRVLPRKSSGRDSDPSSSTGVDKHCAVR